MDNFYCFSQKNKLSAFEVHHRAAEMYEDIRTGPHHVFRIQLTLSQPGGADYAHHPGFSDLAMAMTVSMHYGAPQRT